MYGDQPGFGFLCVVGDVCGEIGGNVDGGRGNNLQSMLLLFLHRVRLQIKQCISDIYF